MSIENDPSFWKWLAGALMALGGAMFGAWKLVDGKLEKKANKKDVNEAIEEVRQEITIQRGHVSKIFDQIRENEQRAQDRHERIMERLPSK